VLLHNLKLGAFNKTPVERTAFNDLLNSHTHEADHKGCSNDKIPMLGLNNESTGDKLFVAHIQTIMHINFSAIKPFVVINFRNLPFCTDFGDPDILVLRIFNIF
jgi:hypothetical protein